MSEREENACRCCGLRSAPTPENVLGPQVVTGFVYLLLFNCACGSTRAVKLWEAPEYADEAA